MPRTAKHCSGNEALQGWCAARAGMSGDAAACGCRLLPCKQPAANAGCCRATNSEAMQRKRSPSGLECNACRDERVQLRANAGCCHASNRLRMQAVAVIETAKAMLRKRSPSRRSAALCAEREQLAANAGCCHDTSSEARSEAEG